MPKTINGVQFDDDLSEQEILSYFEDHPDLVEDALDDAPTAKSAPSRDWGDMITDALPMVGGIAGGLAGAALGPLAIGTAAIGGAGGEGFKRAIQQLRGRRDVNTETVGGTLQGIASEGAGQGASQAIGMGTGKALQVVGRAGGRLLRHGAVASVKSGLKIDRGILEKMAGSKSMLGKEQEIAETLLDQSRGNILSQKGIDRVSDSIDDVARVRTRKINAVPDVEIPRQGVAQLRALRDVQNEVSRGTGVTGDVNAVKGYTRQLLTEPGTSHGIPGAPIPIHGPPSTLVLPPGVKPLPPPVVGHRPGPEIRQISNLTPRKLAASIEQDNRRLKGLFNDASKNTEIQARLAVKRANSATLDRAANTASESDKMRRLIDLRNVANIAGRRADAMNSVSLPDVISLSAMRPEVFIASRMMRPRAQIGTGRLLNKGATRLAKTQDHTQKTAALLRVLREQSGESDQP